MRDWPDDSGLRGEIKRLEEEGDRITHDILHQLYSTTVTPLDREDIHALAAALDDVVDYTEETADVLGLYKIEAPMEQAVELTGVLRDAGRELAAALGQARRRSTELAPHLAEVDRLEDEGDRISRQALVCAVRRRHRPDGGDPLEGRVRAPGAGDRRVRARGARARGDRGQAGLSRLPGSLQSSSGLR